MCGDLRKNLDVAPTFGAYLFSMSLHIRAGTGWF
jgi:hypothetical protein